VDDASDRLEHESAPSTGPNQRPGDTPALGFPRHAGPGGGPATKGGHLAASTDDGSSGWLKAALLAVGAAVAAVVAWGWLSPEPPPATEADEAEPLEDDLAPLEPEPEDRSPPAWVKPTILWTIGVVVALAAAFALLGILKHVVMWIVLALFFSFALEPAVNWLHRRGWRRGVATGLLLFATFVLLAVIFLIFVGTLIRGITQIAEQVPAWADQVKSWASDTLGVDLSTESIAEGAQNVAGVVGSLNPGEALLGLTGSVIGGIFSLFTVGMFLFYMVAEGPKFKRAVLAFFPRPKQEELVSIWEAAIAKTGGYFYSKGLLMVINGGLFYIVVKILGVPGAAPLALFQGFVAEFIPIIGTYIAAIVPLTVALFSVGTTDTLILLIYVLIYQQVENYLLAPRLQSKTMEMHPAVAFGAALAGGAIGGLLWAFLAIPFAATIQASASIWFERHEVLESEFTQEQEARARRRERKEREEEHRSLGERAGRWFRSSRGWLRRKDRDEVEDEPVLVTASVVATTVESTLDPALGSAGEPNPPGADERPG
jgi:predicted PurR-regulated permease PerM